MIVTPALKKQESVYSDFRKDMLLNPVNNDVARYTDEDSVKESIQNLLLTNQGERLFNPTLGSSISKMLFDNILYPETKYIIQDLVATTIKNYEPRCELISVNVKADDSDPNSIVITVTFNVINIQRPITLNVVLSKVR